MGYYRENALHTVNLDNDEWHQNPYPEGFAKSTVPEGVSGEWKVKKYKYSNDNLFHSLYNLQLIRDGRPERVIPNGEYTGLYHNRDVVMSDTPAEAHENNRFYEMATGKVLINGLGLGFVLQAILNKPDVTHVTVIE